MCGVTLTRSTGLQSNEDPRGDPLQSFCGQDPTGSFRFGGAEPCDPLRGIPGADEETGRVLTSLLERASVFFVSTSKLVAMDACTALLPADERCFNELSSPNVHQAPHNCNPLHRAALAKLAADAPCCNDATGSCCMTMQEMMTAGGCFLGGGGGGGGGGDPGGIKRAKVRRRLLSSP
jgi:hypothetical protein